MDNKEAMWFHANYNIHEVNFKEDIRTFDDGPMTYQIMGDKSTVSITMPKLAFERLVLNSKIGFEELERARARTDHPNVQDAYDAYITLLALSTKYD
jgi:hypothetical protein